MDRAKLGVCFGAIAHLHPFRVRDEFAHEFVVNILMNIEPFGGHTELRTVGEGSPEEGLGDFLRINVWQDDGRIVPPALESDSFHMLRSAAHDGFTRIGRTRKRNLRDIRVSRHPFTELVAPGDNVEDSRRKDPGGQFAQSEGAQRREWRGLQNHGVACDQRGRDLPHGQEDREIPGRDPSHHPEWRTANKDRVIVVVLDDLFFQFLFRDRCAPRRRTSDFPFRAIPCFALLGREQRHESLSVGFNGCAEFTNHALTFRNRAAAPVRECALCRSNGLFEMLAGCVGKLCDHLFRRGINRVQGHMRRHRPAIDRHREVTIEARHECSLSLLVWGDFNSVRARSFRPSSRDHQSVDVTAPLKRKRLPTRTKTRIKEAAPT